ncbi:MAG TPA: hypothetical protein VGL77_04645, partial [Armatimonadota bacterium]
EEGVFELRAEVDGTELRPADLQPIKYIIIDTKHTQNAASTSKKTVVHDIDCVQQTDLGKPIVRNTDFWDANGETRVTTSPAGSYRESGDNTGPAEQMYSWGGKSLSAFSYRIDVPETQKPYLLELEYPDDDRRTVNAIILEHNQRDTAQPGSGYETGDWYPLTMKMQTHTVLFWPATNELRIAVVSMNPNMRAAAARIRVSRLDDGVPAGSPNRPDGRRYGSWFEEGNRWLLHFRAGAPEPNEMELDYVGIKRWIETCRFTGINYLCPAEVVYQGVIYNSDELEGLFVRSYDPPRLEALLCEKYGLKYVPEIHLTAGNDWFATRVVAKLAPTVEELLLLNRYGQPGNGSASPRYNPLHPAIQEKYLRIIGELADKLQDSPAFAGISLRLMEWQWGSWNALPSLNWGYEDWTVKQFSKETGVAVPGKDGDPARFAQRFAFLTGPALRERWVAWRCRKMLDYYVRLRDRIRVHHADAVLYLPKHPVSSGESLDEDFGALSDTAYDTVREMGIDTKLLAKTPGIALIPFGYYGRRDSSPVADQLRLDNELDADHLAIGMGNERAFGYGNAYFEVHKQIAIDKLGFPDLQPSGYNGAADAGGRTILERLSVVLAEQDSSTLVEGGFGYVFGQPAAFNEWLGEYKQLPRLPFTPLPEGRDPVAVWYRECDDAFYCYAVNRESYAVPITLTLDGAKVVTALASGDTVPVVEGQLALTLQPYQLRAFKMAKRARITGCVQQVPAEQIELVKNRLVACQTLANAITGPRKDDVTDTERSAFLRQLARAWDAFKHDQYWRARTALSMTPMITVFAKLASYPNGQLHRSQADMLMTQNAMRGEVIPEPMLTAEALSKLVAAGGKTTLADSASYHADWQHTTVLQTADGTLDIDLQAPTDGKYTLSLGTVSGAPVTISVTLAGTALPGVAQIVTPNRPIRSVFPTVSLPAGTVRLSLRAQGAFGVYGVTLQPVYRPLPANHWLTIGPFPSQWNKHMDNTRFDGKWVKAALATPYLPEQALNFTASYPGLDGKPLTWQASDDLHGRFMNRGVNFLLRSGVLFNDICYAVTSITCPEERQARLYIGCDWWANAYLNGELIRSARNPKDIAEDGAQFNAITPLLATVTLKKGVNTLLVKCHGGSAANYFSAFISDPG